MNCSRRVFVFFAILNVVWGVSLSNAYAATITEADIVIVTKDRDINNGIKNNQEGFSDSDIKSGYIQVAPHSNTNIITVRSKSKSIDNLKKGKNVESKSRIGGVNIY